jgi:hypothetical protein
MFKYVLLVISLLFYVNSQPIQIIAFYDPSTDQIIYNNKTYYEEIIVTTGVSNASFWVNISIVLCNLILISSLYFICWDGIWINSWLSFY